MKKFLIPLFVFALIVAGCLPNPGSPSAPTTQPSPTPYPVQPTYTPLPTQAAPTDSATPVVLPSATLPLPTATLAPTMAVDQGTPLCNNHGTMAWNANNQQNDEPYGLSPVNGLSETCWFVAQTHWNENGVEVRAVFAVEPNNVAWLIDYLGGTGWYFSGTESDVRANLAQQATELEARDGKMKTYVIVLPEDADSFPILDHVQQP